MHKRIVVTDPYREVCYVCGQRTQVVAIHLPCDLVTNAKSSTRLCRTCCQSLAVRLLPPNGCPAGCTHGEAHCPEGKRLLAAYQRFETHECGEVATPEAKERYRRYTRACQAYLHHIGLSV